ncbi:MAG: hypothetical protein K2P65_11100, partial [Lachnospiraceae bacterium]|nr:hypothetical protein [Lachnospiraceae bacterium]
NDTDTTEIYILCIVFIFRCVLERDIKENKTIVCMIQRIALAKFLIPIISLSGLAKDCKMQ